MRYREASLPLRVILDTKGLLVLLADEQRSREFIEGGRDREFPHVDDPH